MRRRDFLSASLGVAALSIVPLPSLAVSPATLRAAPARVQLVGAAFPATAVWAYDGQIPGPVIRRRQGDLLQVRLVNDLSQATTIHWHGLRLPNAMDGVPHVTQPPVEPGEAFDYEFELPDAGTFWYHPHAFAAEQLGRGLSGALIVDEAEPPHVDRDVLWVLDDWRLDEQAAIVDDFDNRHDRSHAGRLGNTVTLTGQVPGDWAVRAGERIRLRLVNVANARVFALNFSGHEPQVVAVDGQPCRAHPPKDGRIALGPGARADLIVDMSGDPGERFEVIDDYYPRLTYRLVTLAYSNERPLRASPPAGSIELPPNPLAEPDLAAAETLQVSLAGGAMGGMIEAEMNGRLLEPSEIMSLGRFWTMNGITAAPGHAHPPLFTLQRNRSYRLRLVNRTAWDHPMHLHGHHMKLLSHNAVPSDTGIWHDTVLLSREDEVELAFVADNPGDWVFHCHVLEHQDSGMTALFKVV